MGRCPLVITLCGVDSSDAMLAAARTHARPGVSFVLGDIAHWSDTGHDIIFGNAALQWLPEHREVVARWRAALSAGVQLAIQVLSTADHPSHRAAPAGWRVAGR